MASPIVPSQGVPLRRITRGRRVSRARVLVVGATLAAVSLALALIVVELRLRRREAQRDARPRFPLMLVDESTCYAGHAPRTEQFFKRDDAPLHHRHVTDDDGFRVADPAAPHTGVCRVLALGDSFTSGLHVEAAQAWPAALEAQLRARGYSVRVDNGGLQGHTITQERAEALSRWAALRPRVIVVGRSSNDVNDLANLQEAGCRIGGPPPREFLPALPDGALDLRLVAGAMEARARLHVMTGHLREALRNAGAFPDPPHCAAAEAAYIVEAQDLARGATRAGSRVLYAAFELTSCGGGYTSSDSAAFERRLSAAVGAEGAQSIEMAALLRPPDARLVPWDNHPSPRGHAAIAARLAAHLAASGWLEGCR